MAAVNPTTKDKEFLEKLTRIVLDNLNNEQFGVKELSKEIGFSRSYLYRKLRLLKGQSISQFIRSIRLEQAYKLLREENLTSSEVAYRVGFNNPSYFNACFSACYGFSPGKVKQHLKEESAIKTIEREEAGFEKGRYKKKLIWPTAASLFIILIIAAVSVYKSHQVKDGGKSLAVLPLINLTGNPENDYFVAGLHDGLIAELSQIASLRVISRTSTLPYQDTAMKLTDLAEELNVNTVVEASVSGIGDSIRLLVQVIDLVPRERHIYSQEYLDVMANILKVQSQVARDLAQVMNLKLSRVEKQRIAVSHKVDPEIYRSYLRGMYYMNQGSKESLDKGLEHLHKAIDLDPGDPFAYAALALGYAIKGQEHIDPDEAFLSAIYAADKAVRLDSTIDMVYTARALLYLYQSWEWEKAKSSFEKAIAMNPNNAIAHAHFARYYVLFHDMEQALYHAKKAVTLEPFSASYLGWLALLYYHSRSYEEAEFWAKKSLELREDLPNGNLILGWVSLEREQFGDAIVYHESLPGMPYYKMHLGQTYVRAGQREKALALWQSMQNGLQRGNINPCYPGMMAAYLGFTEQAFDLLNRACKKQSYPITYVDIYPCTQNIRNDPRYVELLEKMNLPHEKHLPSVE